MDTFDSLLIEASDHANSSGAAFDAALLSVLLDPGQMDAAASADELIRVPVLALDDLARTLLRVIPRQMQVVLQKDGWSGSGDENYPCHYRFRDSVFTAQKRTDVYVSEGSSVDARDAGICQETDTADGYVRILAKTVPRSDLEVTFVVTQALETLMQNQEG